MNRSIGSRLGLAAAGLVLVCAGAAWGQVRVEGIEHLPAGGASLSPMPDGSLLVSNIGSSGQDGVEVRCNSRWGGGVHFALDELLIPSPAAREIRTRPKGWDGTVKGNLRLASRPPDGTPGSSLDVECDFAAVGATTVRVTVRDQFGNVILDGVRAGASVQCVISMSPPAGFVPTCGVAIKEKGTGAEKNRVMAVEFEDIFCSVSGLSSATLHEVRSIEISPETCGQCDAWLGTESLLVTGEGVSQCVVSSPRLHTFGVSSSGLGEAFVDEECANPADCDNERRLVVSNLGSSGLDGVRVDLDADGVGGSISLRKHELSGHVILMKAFDDGEQEVSRVVHGEDPLVGGNVLTCDASASSATAIDVQLHDPSGAVVHSSREFTGVLALACSSGPGSERDMRLACYRGTWVLDTSVPDTYTLPDGTSVPNVVTLRLRPVDASGVVRSVHSLHVLANAAASPIEIRPVNDPPSVVRVGGIQAIAMDKGLIAEQPDGSVIVSTPCCIDHDDDGDGIPPYGLELRCASEIGATVTVDAGPLLASTGEIKIKHKGWDGIIYGSHRLVGGGGGGGGAGGIIGLDCDFSPMGAVEIQWEARDVDGALLGSGSVAGSTLGGVTITPEPLGSFLCPALMKAKEKANRMSCSIVITDRDCGVDGLDTTTLQNVRSIEFTPIEPAGSPPWADLDAMQVTFSGMPSLHVLDASLLTFGVEGNGIKDAHVGEVCDDANSCDTSRKIRVHNLGSEGQDGVQLRLGNPLINEVAIGVDGVHMSVASGTCCRGHVIIMKAFDDEGQEAMRVLSSSDADQTLHTMEFDASASGAAGVTLSLRDEFGSVLHTQEFGDSSGSISYVGPCDASEARSVELDSGGVCMELCDGPVTVHIELLTLPGVKDVCWSLSAGTGSPRPIHGISVTGNPTDFIEISEFVVSEVPPPPTCPADFDGDGVRAVPDIFAYLSAWFGQAPSADFNGDGAITVPDIFAFLSAWFAGCP